MLDPVHRRPVRLNERLPTGVTPIALFLATVKADIACADFTSSRTRSIGTELLVRVQLGFLSCSRPKLSLMRPLLVIPRYLAVLPQSENCVIILDHLLSNHNILGGSIHSTFVSKL